VLAVIAFVGSGELTDGSTVNLIVSFTVPSGVVTLLMLHGPDHDNPSQAEFQVLSTKRQ
jgi:hypothetical protein